MSHKITVLCPCCGQEISINLNKDISDYIVYYNGFELSIKNVLESQNIELAELNTNKEVGENNDK